MGFIDLPIGAKIIVIGVGGAGNNAVNRMMDEKIDQVEFYVLNTDVQTLKGSKVPSDHCIVLGEELTSGLGAGGEPNVGRDAAEASSEAIRNIVRGAHMVFIAAGMGGGTGTGAAPVVARIAKEEKALVVAVVTRPFSFEGEKRISNSVEGLHKLKNNVDAIIVVSNDKLLMNNGTNAITTAFAESDKVLSLSVNTVIDLIFVPGIINLDFADIKNTLKESGSAMIGVGYADGPNKAVDAATNAINSSLLEIPINGAKRILCQVTCGPEVSLFEANECVRKITEETAHSADVKFGISVNDLFGDQIRVSVIAADFNEQQDWTKSDYDKKFDSPLLNITSDIKEVEENSTNSENKDDDMDILPNFLKDKNIE